MSAEQLTPAPVHESFRIREWLVEPALDQISRRGEIIKLEPRTMRLLVRLAAPPGQVVNSQQLLDSVWSGVVVGPASVYQAVSQLRKLLGDTDSTPTYIVTIPRKGYRLIAPVERDSTGPAAKDHPWTENPRVASVQPQLQPVPARVHSRRWWTIAVAPAVVTATGVVAVLHNKRGGSLTSTVTTAPLARRTIAVLPFRASKDEAGELLAESVTDLLYHRLVAIRGLPVIAHESAGVFRETAADAREIGRRLHARYLLQGTVARAGEQLHMETTLVDTASGAHLWSIVFDRPVSDITALREEVTQRVIETLRIEPVVATDAVKAPIDLDVYQLYRRGMRLMDANATVADVEKAAVLFARTTALDPGFARGYGWLGNALIYASDLRPNLKGAANSEIAADAQQAFDRALALNPALAEVWVGRARLTKDPGKAEELYRRGLQLAPNYSVGSMFFAEFLSARGRAGEAIDVIDRARELDPISPTLLWLNANALMHGRSDVAGSEKLLREALATDPDFGPALIALANSRYQWSGEFAEAIRTLEKRLDSEAGLRAHVASMYLDLDDLAAAIDVWQDSPAPPPFTPMVITKYQRNTTAAAQVARSVLAGSNSPLFAWAAEAIRDEAIATGDYAQAIKLLESVHSEHTWTWTAPGANRAFAIVYAHTLMLAGETQRGRKLARSLLVGLDGEEVGRPKHWFGRERAALFAMLGEDQRALEELAASQQLKHWTYWWYTAELDPIYAHLRSDPRFQALVERARRHSREQRALLEELRRTGEVPSRS